MTPVQNDFSQGSVARNILSIAVPMTVAQVVNILYSLVDRMYIGHIPGVGHTSLTGMGLTLPLISIVLAFANLGGMGGSPLCSIYRGKGEEGLASAVMGNTLSLLLFFGFAIPLVTIPFLEPILVAFGASDATLPYAKDYSFIYLLGTPFVTVGLGMNPFINSQGFGNKGMLTVMLGAVVNLVLDPILIYGLNLGVKGAAIATIIAQACSAVWVLSFLTGKKSLLPLHLCHLRPQWDHLRRIISLGLSGFFTSITNSLVQIVCNKVLHIYGGDLYVGVMTIINSLRLAVKHDHPRPAHPHLQQQPGHAPGRCACPAGVLLHVRVHGPDDLQPVPFCGAGPGQEVHFLLHPPQSGHQRPPHRASGVFLGSERRFCGGSGLSIRLRLFVFLHHVPHGIPSSLPWSQFCRGGIGTISTASTTSTKFSTSCSSTRPPFPISLGRGVFVSF